MTADPVPPQINITDLENVVKVIDVASERGAFKGSELSAVGTVRDKIANFLASIPKPEAEAEAEAVAEEEAAPVAEEAKPTRRKTKTK